MPSYKLDHKMTASTEARLEAAAAANKERHRRLQLQAEPPVQGRILYPPYKDISDPRTPKANVRVQVVAPPEGARLPFPAPYGFYEHPVVLLAASADDPMNHVLVMGVCCVPAIR